MSGAAGRLTKKHSTLFIYLGRRGGISRFTIEMWKSVLKREDLPASLLVSSQNEDLSELVSAGGDIVAERTFDRSLGAFSVPSLLRLRVQLRDVVRRGGYRNAVTLLPHVWTPLLAPVLRRAGLNTVTVVHDAVPHPGDHTALVHRWCHLGVGRSDRVVTLSRSVTTGLAAGRSIDADRVLTLFHPASRRDMGLRSAPPSGAPLRILFLGRIMPYKGLDIFVRAAELLRERGVGAEVGVFGEGDIGAARPRLSALGAEIRNNWLSEAEISAALTRYDVLVLSHVEASQSGVAALALGAGMPVVATPVGGLVEQIEHGRTGLVASAVSAAALAEEIARLNADRAMYAALSAEILNRQSIISYDRFVQDLMPVLL